MNGNSTPRAIDWATMPEWITTEEAAELGGYHPEHVRRLARQGKIGAEKRAGHDWWIDRDKFRVYLAMIESLGPKKYDPRGAPELAQGDGE